jgi:8-oxo-dGTP pyrophosphatase MutT (NUDIX family)
MSEPAAPQPSRWSAIDAARACDLGARLPFVVDGELVGWVARSHLRALREEPDLLEVTPQQVRLLAAPADRDRALADLHRRLRAQGLIRAWRDETYALPDAGGGRCLAHIERAAARFWGTLTFGAHATGFVSDDQGRPAQLWIAQRAFDKATDPGLFDNLIGGGVGAGQSPLQTLLREGWEEAGLDARTVQRATPGSVLRLQRDIAEGLQHEWLYSFDLELPAAVQPVNQDGEVAAFRLLPWRDAFELAAGRSMTVDAALVTLDFVLRHGLVPDDEGRALQPRCAELRIALRFNECEDRRQAS